jgi:hypothetical protein
MATKSENEVILKMWCVAGLSHPRYLSIEGEGWMKKAEEKTTVMDLLRKLPVGFYIDLSEMNNSTKVKPGDIATIYKSECNKVWIKIIKIENNNNITYVTYDPSTVDSSTSETHSAHHEMLG